MLVMQRKKMYIAIDVIYKQLSDIKSTGSATCMQPAFIIRQGIPNKWRKNG